MYSITSLGWLFSTCKKGVRLCVQVKKCMNSRKHLPLADLKLHHQEAELFSRLVFVFRHMQRYFAANKHKFVSKLKLFSGFRSYNWTYRKSIWGSSTYNNIMCRERILWEHLHCQIHLITGHYNSSKHLTCQEVETNHGRKSSPEEHAHPELWQPITTRNHHTKSCLVVHSHQTAQGISSEVTICELKYVYHIFHEDVLRLQVRHDIHESHHLLVFLVF